MEEEKMTPENKDQIPGQNQVQNQVQNPVQNPVQITRHVNDNPDSIEIGTPAKGGAIKIYGNFDDPEAFKKKIDVAKEVKQYAQANLMVNV